jgi:hypothetical protein
MYAVRTTPYLYCWYSHSPGRPCNTRSTKLDVRFASYALVVAETRVCCNSKSAPSVQVCTVYVCMYVRMHEGRLARIYLPWQKLKRGPATIPLAGRPIRGQPTTVGGRPVMHEARRMPLSKLKKGRPCPLFAQRPRMQSAGISRPRPRAWK